MTDEEIQAAMFAGDTETLQDRLPCRCCCAEHTFVSCPARRWYGCRGNGVMTDDYDAWCRAFPTLPWD